MDKTEKLRKKAQEFRAAGYTYREIAAEIKVSTTHVARLLNPKLHEAAKERARQRQRERNLALKNRDLASVSALRMQAKAELEARLAEIPDDTRTTTARVFGDPLPGRSALDQRRAA